MVNNISNLLGHIVRGHRLVHPGHDQEVLQKRADLESHGPGVVQSDHEVEIDVHED